MSLGPDVKVSCHAFFAFEVAQQIDLSACRRGLGDQVARPTATIGSPDNLGGAEAPLRVKVPNLAPVDPRVADIEIVLFDFGAASVNYRLEYEGSLEGLVDLSVALAGGNTLSADARRKLLALLPRLGGAVIRPSVAPIIEDYFVFELGSLAQFGGRLPGDFEHRLARVLRAAPRPLSDDEIRDAMGARLSYGDDDLTFVDWNGAVIFNPEPHDTRAVLEFANVQLLELRHLDSELDRRVEAAYTMLARPQGGLASRLRVPTAALRDLGAMQMDGAILFERVSNALKLIGDQFLSRVYRAVSERFHFGDWDRAILRKLDVLDRIYQKVGDQVSAHRLEMLEWIVIGLIALDLVLRLMS